MDAISYCDAIADELDVWKDKIDKVFRKLDDAPCEDKEQVSPQVNEIHMILLELRDRIETLRTDCPDSWEDEKAQVDTKLGEVREKWDVFKMKAPGRRLAGTNL